MDITILGIESSCDDTSAAVIRNTTLLSNVIASQAVHMKYGGVIPELASHPHVDGFDFSFSGLKTSFLYTLRDAVADDPDFIDRHKADLCASLQHTIVEILLKQLVRAAKEYDIRDIAVAGGVSANSGLRNGVVEEGRRRGWRTFVPEFRFTTDNAAMIAVAGYYHYLHGDFSSLDVSPVARIEELM